jgi:hypothetical protein
MNERNAVQELVLKIISTEVPNEIKTYDIAEDFLMKKIYDDHLSINEIMNANNAHNEFWPELGQVITSASLLAGTIKTMYEIRKLKSENESYKKENITHIWREKLIESGLAPQIADDVSKKYVADLEAIGNK